jgi:hypothetical protein
MMTHGRINVSGPSTSRVGRSRSALAGASQNAMATSVAVANVPNTATHSAPARSNSCQAAGTRRRGNEPGHECGVGRNRHGSSDGSSRDRAAIVGTLADAAVAAGRRAKAAQHRIEEREQHQPDDRRHAIENREPKAA